MRSFMLMLGVLAGLALVCAPANATPVSMELVLALDVSGSVSTVEWQLQRDGYVSAFLDPNLQNIISSKGGIAVTLVQWSGDAQQSQSIAWTLINDSASAIAFSNAVGAMSRPFSGLTAIGTAINYSAGLFAGNGYEGERLVIDISGDGERNDGDPVTAARDAAAAQGIYINGLPIINEVPTLESYYISNVITGTGAFTVEATNYSVFAPSILQKLTLEATNAPSIAGEVPEPGSMGLALAGLGLLAALARRRSVR